MCPATFVSSPPTETVFEASTPGGTVGDSIWPSAFNIKFLSLNRLIGNEFLILISKFKVLCAPGATLANFDSSAVVQVKVLVNELNDASDRAVLKSNISPINFTDTLTFCRAKSELFL